MIKSHLQMFPLTITSCSFDAFPFNVFNTKAYCHLPPFYNMGPCIRDLTRAFSEPDIEGWLPKLDEIVIITSFTNAN